MNNKNYNDLIKKYPDLFPIQEDSQEPFALFGFECDIGWYDIIENACQIIYSDYKHYSNYFNSFKKDLENIEKTITLRQEWDKDKSREWIIQKTEESFKFYSEKLTNEKTTLPITAQIKEKYGTLRWYVDTTNRCHQKIIDFTELMSEITCETCGARGKTYRIGWHKTLCIEHATEKYGQKRVDEYNQVL
jgi:hypothetical protein